MSIFYRKEHLACKHYDRSEKPLIEVVRIVKGERRKLSTVNNEIECVIEGRMRYFFGHFPPYEAARGQMIFRPSGGEYAYEALSNAMVVIFRTHNHVMLCNNFSVEKLYGLSEAGGYDEPEEDKEHIGTMEINARMWHFLNGIIDCVRDGLKCTHWFELKVRELELLMRMYYTKEELYLFFYMILSGNMTFSEYVRLNWRDFRSVKELAESMHMTEKTFRMKFKPLFGQTPHRWMAKNTARIVYKEITSTQKSFKVISAECGFTSETQFTRFCKKELGETPTKLREQSDNLS